MPSILEVVVYVTVLSQISIPKGEKVTALPMSS
jgi:hypothetical protein